MLKTFKEFLTEKGHEEEAFKALDAVEQLKLQNEYNAELKKGYEKALTDKASAESLEAFKKEITSSNDSVIKAIEGLGSFMKAQAEKAGLNPETLTEPELIKMIKKSSDEAGVDSKGRVAGFTVKVNPQDFLNEVNKAAALMTTANIVGIGNGATGGNAGQWSPLFGNYVDNNIYRVPYLTSYILDDVSVTTAEGTENIYWTERVNEEGDAAWLAEGALKPLADAEWKSSMTTTREVAVRWKFTHRFLFHTRRAVEDFQIHARELMDVKVAVGVLNGSGVAPEILGVTTAGSAFVVPTEVAGTVFMPNIYDAINAMVLQIRKLGYQGRIIARLPIAYEMLMQSIKTTYGEYIIPPFVSQDGKSMGDVLIRFDDRLATGKILVGVLSNFKVVFAEQVMFDEGYENDDFSKNLVSRKLEAFVGSYLPANLKPSIIYADIAEVLEDIAQPEA